VKSDEIIILLRNLFCLTVTNIS